MPSGITEVSVLTDGTKIVDIDAAIQTEADEVVDATGLHLLPGIVDDQVHFREPGLTHKEDLAHASRACAKGGVTTFLEMPNTKPQTTTKLALDKKYKLKIISNNIKKYSLHGMTYMRVFVGCNTTRIHSHMIRLQRSKNFLSVRQAIVNTDFSHLINPLTKSPSTIPLVPITAKRLNSSGTLIFV